jgi:putative nucleotidyltransferase with HDIG domain
VPPSSVVLLDRANHFTDEYFSVLTDRRFTVRRVTSLEEALACLAPDRDGPPDALLLNGSGRPVAEAMSDLGRVREADPDLPILVLTLEPNPAVASRARLLGAAGVLAAPWLPRDVVAALERATQIRRRRREEARVRATSLEVKLGRLEAEVRRAADLELANAQLARELTAAREANSRITQMIKAVQSRNVALEARFVQFNAIAELSASLAGDLDGVTIAELTVREAARLLAADGAALCLLDGEARGEALVARFVLGRRRDPAARIRPGEGIQGWVAQTGRPVALADASRDPRVIPADRMGDNSERIACVPLALRGRVLGTLMLNRTGPSGPAFAAQDVELLARLAAHAAVALDHARHAEAVEHGYLAALRGMVRAVEERAPWTCDHSENVAFFSLRLARAIGLDEARQTVIRQAGILHDVGHALISTAITAKADRLTADEWAVMRDHPVLGHRLLEPVGFLRDARAIVLDHHERVDGSGYPNGRSRDSLAVETRIVSIAEAFDYMTRERPYQPGLTVEEAAAELRSHRGTQFDSDLVDSFADLLHRDERGLAGAAAHPSCAGAAEASGGRAA